MGRSWVRQNRVVMSFAFALAVLIFARPSLKSMMVGIPFVFAGMSLRTWSSGYIRKSKALATEGPYAWSRNPLYLGSFFVGVGFCVMANQVWIWVFFLLSFASIYYLVVKDEEVALRERFGREYTDYACQVPRFFPKWPRHWGNGQFAWRLVLRHREYYAWLGGALAIIWLWWRSSTT